MSSRRGFRAALGFGAAALVASIAPFAIAGKGDTILVSRSGDGTEGASGSSSEPAISANGRFVAFTSQGSNLNGPDDLAARDVYVYDTKRQRMELVSRKSKGGAGGDEDSGVPSISADGRFVAFESDAENLVGAAQAGVDIYVYDRKRDKLELISRKAKNGPGGDGSSFDPSISANGRFVAFESEAENLSAADDADADVLDVFVYDRKRDKVELVSRKSNNGPGGDEDSRYAAIAAGGRFVAFQSAAENLSGADASFFDTFVYDRKRDKVELVSRESNGGPGADDQSQGGTEISASGRFVTFHSGANNLSAGDGIFQDVFVYDRARDKVELVSRESGNGPGGTFPSEYGDISNSGRYVAFNSSADNLSDRDEDSVADIFVYDRKRDIVTLASREQDNGPGADDHSNNPAISADGRFVAFWSSADNLPGNYFNTQNIFRYDYLGR